MTASPAARSRHAKSALNSIGLLLVGLLVVASGRLAPAAPPVAEAEKGPAAAAEAAPAPADGDVARGEEIFLREWIPGDPRSHGGDGLGPVFNDSSCVSCHNQGGVGGGGSAGKNVDLVIAFANDQQQQHVHIGAGPFEALTQLFFGFGGGQGGVVPVPAEQQEKKDDGQKDKAKRQREALAKVHPGFANARSVVLHRFGTSEGYSKWRTRMKGTDQFSGMVVGGPAAAIAGAFGPSKPQEEIQRLKTEAQFGGGGVFFGPAQVGQFAFLRSQRNTTALFGAGLLDAIPAKVLKRQAARKQTTFPEISGRVARLKDGRFGRFGWKAQEPSLTEFVKTACAVELGLEVPGRGQVISPEKPDAKAPGLDLNDEEVVQLVSYVAELPAPTQTIPANDTEKAYLAHGETLFAKVGCASCHTQDLGEVKAVYSDLLLHDMGPDLADSGSYGGVAPNSTEEEEMQGPLPLLTAQFGGGSIHGHSTRKMTAEEEAKLVGALRHEWRTPPLWGVRESAPYLHDGRARTLEQAIALHGGEASKTTTRFFKLPAAQRHKVVAFLKSLKAPNM